jgi:streptogramin lyase
MKSILLVVGLAVTLSACSDRSTSAQATPPPASTATTSAVVVSGRVTDAAGAPVRAALVTVIYGTRSIARFADASGAYRITDVPRAEQLKVRATRSGFADQEQTLTPSGDVKADFRLQEQFDHMQLTSAEVMSLLPQNSDVAYIKTHCISCHGLTQPEHLRGVGDPRAWNAVFHGMMLRYDVPQLTEQDMAYAATILPKYFGPDAPAPSAQTVQRAPISDAALNATFHMIELKAGTMQRRAYPHSVVADNKGGAWVVESGNNRVTHWDLATGTLKSVELEPNAIPHTPTLDHKGRVWTTAVALSKMAVIDPNTYKVSYVALNSWPHTVSTDADGNIWGNGPQIFRINPETQEVRYWQTLAVMPQPGSWKANGFTPGSKPLEKRPFTAYHAVRDSKGILWYTSLDVGGLIRLDPTTGQQKQIRPEGVNGSRGLDIDADDNIWYSDWTGFRLAKYDQKTDQTKLYNLPTKYGMPYSVFVDKKRGHIWIADYAGNNLTRFDPRTETFIEFPLPHNESYPRFLSIDDQGRIWFGEWWNGRVGVMDPGVS